MNSASCAVAGGEQTDADCLDTLPIRSAGGPPRTRRPDDPRETAWPQLAPPLHAPLPPMAQVFDRGLVLALKLTAVIAVVLIFAGFYLWRWGINYPYQVGSPPPQPLPFSHLHHVGEDGIDCRYCHTSVENSAFAGIPGSDTCMSCHSQLFRQVPLFDVLHASVSNGTRLVWTRVNQLPDFVYFNHSAHVSHGVPCTACHGRVDTMPMMERAASLHMRWCLSCHRQPQAHLVVPAAVFSTLAHGSADPAEQHRLLTRYGLKMRRWLTDCSTCHR